MSQTISEDRMRAARANSEMQELYFHWTVLRRVTTEDGKIIEQVVWKNADAERRYNELKKQFREQKEE